MIRVDAVIREKGFFVGMGIHNDLKAISLDLYDMPYFELGHIFVDGNKQKINRASCYKFFFNKEIQETEGHSAGHDSIRDARASIELY